MTAAELLQTVEEHASDSEVEMADALYAIVRNAVENNDQREMIRVALESIYNELKVNGVPKQRRAIREVLAAFDGWCTPSAAL